MTSVLYCIGQEHNSWLVLLAGLLCASGSWVTARLFMRTIDTKGRQKLGWHFIAAIAAGATIWSTHFVAMLGYNAGVPIDFDAALTTVSLLIAVIGTAIGFSVATFGNSRAMPMLGGALVGLAISAMHYTGMIAYRVQGVVSWDQGYLAASVALAVVLSAAALHLGVRARRFRADLMALVLTLAVVGLHFTGMTAFHIEPLVIDASFSNPGAATSLAAVIGLVAVVIFAIGLVTYLIDATVRSDTMAQIKGERDYANAVIDSLPGVFYHYGPDGRLLRWNRNFEEITGYSAEELFQREPHEFFSGEDRQRIRETVEGLFEDGAAVIEADFQLKNKSLIPYRFSGVRFEYDGRQGFVGVGTDIAESRRAADRVRHLATHDSLTGLANRNAFYERLSDGLAPGPGGSIGLLFVDLDGFKLVNDTRGHRIGDILLRQVADRLAGICNGEDTFLCRLGGDEFAILHSGSDPHASVLLASAIVEQLSDPYEIDRQQHVRIGASVGIAFTPEHGQEGELLLSRADMALYNAKAAGRGQVRVFRPDMESAMQERVLLESLLRRALDSGEGLFVFYQPVIDIETREITAREALIRWFEPSRGWISPGEFVPIAEQSDLIEKICHFVIHQACSDAARWEDRARVAVNVSAGQLGKGTLSSMALSALAASGLKPDRLEVELTETALVENEQQTITDLRQLRAMGVRVALDDFGTGFSSLAHLRAFAFDKIKIDGSFVKDAIDRPDCAAVVRAIADLGQSLGVLTVAEGVETTAHLECVTALGCREVQGFLFGGAVPDARDRETVARLNASLAETALRA